MKKSNLYLLITLLVFVAFFVGLHVDLWARYKANNFTSESAETGPREKKLVIPLPKHIQVMGLNEVWIKPSDSFYLSYSDNEHMHIVQGDTIIITGYDTTREVRRNAAGGMDSTTTMSGSGTLVIHGRIFPSIQLLGTNQVHLNGDTDSTKKPDPSARIDMIAAGFNIGEDENMRGDLPKEYFDSLNIHIGGTEMALYRNVNVKSLKLDVDNRSSVKKWMGMSIASA